MNVRPKFLRRVSIFFAVGLFAIAALYVGPYISLPQRPKLGCPLLAWLRPLSKASIQPTDSLELITSFGELPRPYKLRLYGDGHIDRDTVIALSQDFSIGCPLHEADKHLQVAPAQALALIAKARDGGFCRMCNLYRSTHPMQDEKGEMLTLNVEGKSYEVANVSGNPPYLFAELSRSLASISPIPEYASTEHPSPQRKAECRQFEDTQTKILLKHFDKH